MHYNLSYTIHVFPCIIQVVFPIWCLNICPKYIDVCSPGACSLLKHSKWESTITFYKSMFSNCTENGYLFSCFQNFGRIKNSDHCKKVCNSNNLSQFGLNDFFNFHDRLNQSNFLIKVRGTQYKLKYYTIGLVSACSAVNIRYIIYPCLKQRIVWQAVRQSMMRSKDVRFCIFNPKNYLIP